MSERIREKQYMIGDAPTQEADASSIDRTSKLAESLESFLAETGEAYLARTKVKTKERVKKDAEELLKERAELGSEKFYKKYNTVDNLPKDKLGKPTWTQNKWDSYQRMRAEGALKPFYDDINDELIRRYKLQDLDPSDENFEQFNQNEFETWVQDKYEKVIKLNGNNPAYMQYFAPKAETFIQDLHETNRKNQAVIIRDGILEQGFNNVIALGRRPITEETNLDDYTKEIREAFRAYKDDYKNLNPTGQQNMGAQWKKIFDVLSQTPNGTVVMEKLLSSKDKDGITLRDTIAGLEASKVYMERLNAMDSGAEEALLVQTINAEFIAIQDWHELKSQGYLEVIQSPEFQDMSEADRLSTLREATQSHKTQLQEQISKFKINYMNYSMMDGYEKVATAYKNYLDYLTTLEETNFADESIEDVMVVKEIAKKKYNNDFNELDLYNYAPLLTPTQYQDLLNPLNWHKQRQGIDIIMKNAALHVGIDVGDKSIDQVIMLGDPGDRIKLFKNKMLDWITGAKYEQIGALATDPNLFNTLGNDPFVKELVELTKQAEGLEAEEADFEAIRNLPFNYNTNNDVSLVNAMTSRLFGNSEEIADSTLPIFPTVQEFQNAGTQAQLMFLVDGVRSGLIEDFEIGGIGESTDESLSTTDIDNDEMEQIILNSFGAVDLVENEDGTFEYDLATVEELGNYLPSPYLTLIQSLPVEDREMLLKQLLTFDDEGNTLLSNVNNLLGSSDNIMTSVKSNNENLDTKVLPEVAKGDVIENYSVPTKEKRRLDDNQGEPTITITPSNIMYKFTKVRKAVWSKEMVGRDIYQNPSNYNDFSGQWVKDEKTGQVFQMPTKEELEAVELTDAEGNPKGTTIRYFKSYIKELRKAFEGLRAPIITIDEEVANEEVVDGE